MRWVGELKDTVGLWIIVALLSMSFLLMLLATAADFNRICEDRNRQLASVQSLLEGLARTDATRPDIDPATMRERLALFASASDALAPVEC